MSQIDIESVERLTDFVCGAQNSLSYALEGMDKKYWDDCLHALEEAGEQVRMAKSIARKAAEGNNETVT